MVIDLNFSASCVPKFIDSNFSVQNVYNATGLLTRAKAHVDVPIKQFQER